MGFCNFFNFKLKSCRNQKNKKMQKLNQKKLVALVWFLQLFNLK